MKIRVLPLLCIILLSASCAKIPVLKKTTADDDLPNRLSEAQVVLVGRLAALNERAVTGQEQDLVDGRLRTRMIWYDVATLEVIETLKGTCDSSTVHVKFLSFDQTQFPPWDTADCHAFSYYDIWNPGIWIIDIDKDLDPRFTVQRGNFEPMNKLEDVKRALRCSP